MSKNSNLHKAHKAKNDEFYTQITDIEKELKNYREHFKNKVIFCNCDDPEYSNFWKYFSLNFTFLGLKKLISTHYEADKPSYKMIMYEDESGLHKNTIPLMENGDFRSPECIELLKEADVVVTNPPFSLFREYVAQLIKYQKKFVIIGSQNSITYKEIFPLIKENQLWLGINNGPHEFKVPATYDKFTREDENGVKYAKLGNIAWYTNLDISKRHQDIILFKDYDPNVYPQYDNYNAINVNKVSEIPHNYNGLMGVPITFLNKYNPEQFEILSCNDYRKNSSVPFKSHGLIKDKEAVINGKATYVRILIKRKGMKS